MPKIDVNKPIPLLPYIKRMQTITEQIAEEIGDDKVVFSVEVKYDSYNSGPVTQLYLYIEDVGNVTRSDPEKAFEEMVEKVKDFHGIEVVDSVAGKAKYSITN